MAFRCVPAALCPCWSWRRSSCSCARVAEAGVTRLEITRREVVLQRPGVRRRRRLREARRHGPLRARSAAAAEPRHRRPRRSRRRTRRAWSSSRADFYLLKPVDPARGNGRLFYEAGNRGTKRILPVFQDGAGSADPTTAAEFGNGALMRQGFTLLWMGWQWDVPAGRMRMEIPIATDNGAADHRLGARQLHSRRRTRRRALGRRPRPRAYPVVDPDERRARAATCARCRPIRRRWCRAQRVAVHRPRHGHARRRLRGRAASTTSSIARAIRAWSASASPARAISSASSSTPRAAAGQSDARASALAIGWGVSQTGRFLRHFVYEGFNEDERGRIVFDGVFDQVGGAGRGSFNHRFGQQSRDQLQHFNILYPGGHVPVHRRRPDRSGDRRHRWPAGARAAQRTPCRRSSTC